MNNDSRSSPIAVGLGQMKNVLEFTQITKLIKQAPRSPFQTNNVFEADCEILKIPTGFICSTTDSIGEEIDLQFYESPELWGWMTAMSSISDLAASGSRALGILLANQWKYKTTDQEKILFFNGFNKALKKSGVSLLGGDSGSGGSHCHTATGLGFSKKKPLTRIGIKPGEILCLIGRKTLGQGPAFAFRFLLQKPAEFFPENQFRPLPYPKIVEKIRPWVNASIDTSDGLATSLQILSELNKVSFQISWNQKWISETALHFCERADLHPLMLLMGDHGDFQTLISVSPKNLNRVLSVSDEIIPIGIAGSAKRPTTCEFYNQIFELPTELVTSCPRDLSSILLLTLDANKHFKSHKSPAKTASNPTKRITPKSLGEEK